jgi:hypothetical protein
MGKGARPRSEDPGAGTGYAGRGMGGGGMYGARPDHKPQIPEEFKEIVKKKQEDTIKARQEVQRFQRE